MAGGTSMNLRGVSTFCLGVISSFCVVLLVVYNTKPFPAQPRGSSVGLLCDNFKASRDHLSKHLNFMKQEYGKLSCEVNKLLKKQQVTGTGGWCKAVSSPNSTEHKTDMTFAAALAKFFTGKSVGSFGDGPGLYKKYFDKTGLLIRYDAYDGAPFCEEVTNGAVKFLDLSAPQYGLPVYDWIMSVEVAEHIPAQYENVFVDNLVRHAREGIVLSWGAPKQPGFSHVNGKSFEDLKKIMHSNGFEHDEPASRRLRDSGTFFWIKGNVNVYRRTQKVDLSNHA